MERLSGVGNLMISTDTMTLGRFVRVTLNNIRLLMRTINAPLTTPMINSPEAAPHQRDRLPPAPITAAAPVAGLVLDTPPPEQREAAAPFSDIADASEPDADLMAVGGNDEEESQAELLAQAAAAGLLLTAVLESLLFVADGPVAPAQLARACGVAAAAVEQGLRELADAYGSAGRGLRVQERAGRYQLVTAPETGALVEAFLQVDVTTRLSGPALEALAVIAYRQPVTRAQVEAVRGVDCSGVLRSLVQRGLVEETGRLEAPGRPVLYGITDLFLNHFGLTSLHELPPLAIGEQDRMDEVLRDSAAALLTVASAAADKID